MKMTLGSFLNEICCKYGDNEYLYFPSDERVYSYKEFWRYASYFAEGLILLNLQKGDRIAVKSLNNPQYAAVLWASFQLGIITAGFHPDFTPKEVMGNMEYTKSKILITDDPYYSGRDFAYPSMSWEEMEDYLNHNKNKVDKREIMERQNKVNAMDAAMILFTSGTSGKNKAVLLKHKAVILALLDYKECNTYRQTDNALVCTSFSHNMAGIYGLLSTASVGAKMTLLESFKTIRAAETIQREKCSIFWGVPSMYIFLLEQKNRYDLRSLRTGIIAGSCVSPQLYKRIYKEINMVELMQSYGQTETLAITQTCINDSLEELSCTTGRALRNVQIKIADLTTGAEAESCSDGEVLVKAPYLMQGYLNEDGEVCEALDEDGWFHTGDIGCLNKNGYLYIKSRIKDRINRGGEKISPIEIEEALLLFPEIKEAAVIGVPSETMIEEICAYITLEHIKTINLEVVRKTLEKELSKFKIPKYFRILEQFPKTRSGKISKEELKKIWNRDLSGSE